MLEAQRNKNIEMYTFAEITKFSGYVGNFEVEITQKPRYTTQDCNGCGACFEVCPTIGACEFNQGMDPRKAIYISFAQAVPSKAQIDMKVCIKCGNCVNVCELKAIDFNQTETKITKKFGGVIVATGWDEFIPEIGYLGYGIYDNVITEVTFERLLAPNGPVVGHLVKPSDNQPPKSILFINCVGSRDMKRNIYCSSGVCCMVSIKNAKLAKSHNPEMEVVVSYIDIRAAGKGYEEYYLEARKARVDFIRTKVVSIEEDPQSKVLTVIMEDSLDPNNTIKKFEFDMIVLSTSMVPSKSFASLNELLGLQLSSNGFLKEFHQRLNTVDTDVPGIVLAGACHGPKDISESIMQAKGASSSMCKLLANREYRIDLIRAITDTEKCSGCGMCAATCPYQAITIDLEQGAIVDNIICRGCGLCASVCANEAITLRYYRGEHYNDLIDGILVNALR
ncbi:H(2)/formate:CoB-CoM heterodisulfide,ferredoxin reductase subunit A [Candidatus Lokiarchaeum ossiferum]|uniref:CoB--CoM heterodisulfide reductase iron-sulfur subunit A n=1 Tax=Candidatus Lokiarchaeum ossiferum TaxID=2951803 RepID=A0ABY6HTR7_9ARCH|nr:H(2)/formate:CoB-CoM heterodisulfide,ferredoxin reductase subunit A [Candidatus Lokiarchaeum sp. B-35]